MVSSQLPNYLLSNRKRLALSQDEVAFLLGTKSGAKVSRYERFTRMPSLETALAFEVIFQRAPSELFGGLYQQIEQEVAARAKALTDTMNVQFDVGELSLGL
jgi:transcriptional regulator with XRE-family HTH domain